MREPVHHISEDKVWGKAVQAYEVILKADYSTSKKKYM